jgi:hypothetical protein
MVCAYPHFYTEDTKISPLDGGMIMLEASVCLFITIFEFILSSSCQPAQSACPYLSSALLALMWTEWLDNWGKYREVSCRIIHNASRDM